MVYLGRLAGAGWTKHHMRCGLYGGSGRSGFSKARLAQKYPERIFIDSSLTKKPYDQITPEEKTWITKYLEGDAPYSSVSSLVKDLDEDGKKILKDQIKYEEFIFYNGIRLDGHRAILSNGVHTEDIVKDHELSKVLSMWGPELDNPDGTRTPYTPRIGAFISLPNSDVNMVMGITSEKGVSEMIFPARYQKTGIIPGISTYAGNPDAPSEIVINREPVFLELPAVGKTAQKLADDLFDWMDPNFAVFTAAALLNPKTNNWELAVRNLHKR